MTKRMKIWTWTVFAFYLAWLVWVILFKFHLPGAGPLKTVRSVEWIPFAPREIELRQALEEMALNLIVFIPLGAYLAALLPTGKRRWIPLIGLGVSVMFEVLQYAFAIGAADVTDVILNTAGTLAGVLFYGMLHLLFKKRALTVLNALGTVCEVLFCGMLLLVMAANGRF
ncbi:MAG: VanZ family protein [Clostridiales bacterium]|nr:VanZ family protein [Clostridiales bacterium]